jgi:PAS domain-containing protein
VVPAHGIWMGDLNGMNDGDPSGAPPESVLDQVPALVWMSGPDYSGSYFNKTWLDFRGRRLEEEVDGGWLSGVHPDDRPAIDAYSDALVRRAPFQAEYRLLRHDGGLLVVREARAAAPQAIRPGQTLLWDRRFRVTLAREVPDGLDPESFSIGPLGEADRSALCPGPDPLQRHAFVHGDGCPPHPGCGRLARLTDRLPC